MDNSKIKEQVEFYFSNSNYAKDKFLQETAIKNDKCIPISIILNFKRMQQLGADMEAVKAAAADSKVVELVGDALKKIETKEYLEYRADKEIGKRVVHMAGFNKDCDLDDLKEIIGAHCKPVKILLRKGKDRVFTGSCLVEFETVEEAENALNLKIEIAPKDDAEAEEPAKKAKPEPRFVEIMSKEAYMLAKPESKESANERFIAKVKADFIPKLFVYETTAPMSIAEIKEVAKNVAFVDTENKVIRMKYREDWEDNEFGSEEKKIKMKKMPEEEAKEYVSKIHIKKVPKRK